jgi:hypothetical protein
MIDERCGTAVALGLGDIDLTPVGVDLQERLRVVVGRIGTGGIDGGYLMKAPDNRHE